MSRYSNQHRYCVILAGGDGKRLRQLTQCVSADARPKQFCPFLGGWTPLQATRQRAARSLDPERTLFVVTRAHERNYTDELSDVRPWQVLIQPDNKGTAPAILLSLLYLDRLDPEASAVLLPSDHHYGDERGFLDAVHRAFEAGDERTQPAILLGAAPTHPEVGYGWIERGPMTAGRSGLFRVMRFWEKPSLPVAKVLLNLGCLWNTFVMVGRVRTFLGMIQTATPQLYGNFQRHETTSGHFDSETLYETLTPVDFSRDVLAQSPAELAVLDAGPVGWSDLGEPERVVRLMAQLDSQCDWLKTWQPLPKLCVVAPVIRLGTDLSVLLSITEECQAHQTAASIVTESARAPGATADDRPMARSSPSMITGRKKHTGNGSRNRMKEITNYAEREPGGERFQDA